MIYSPATTVAGEIFLGENLKKGVDNSTNMVYNIDTG